MSDTSFSLLAYIRRQFDGQRDQRFDFLTVAGEKVTGTFAAWPEADDQVVVVLSAADRLCVIVVAHLVYIAEHRPDARDAIGAIGGKVRDVGAGKASWQ